MPRALVVFASKYGSTREVAQAVASALGADIVSADTLPDVAAYDLVVVGSPIYAGTYLSAVTEFASRRHEQLQTRMVATFVTAAADPEPQPGLTGDDLGHVYTRQDYAQGLAKLTGGRIVACRGFGGRLVPSQLDEHDRILLGWLARAITGQELTGFDQVDLQAARQWGEELRAALAS
jgi:menaquinone-dependent protoporphyrinogen IX oxidase